MRESVLKPWKGAAQMVLGEGSAKAKDDLHCKHSFKLMNDPGDCRSRVKEIDDEL